MMRMFGKKRIRRWLGGLLLPPCCAVSLVALIMGPLPLPAVSPAGPQPFPGDFQKGVVVESWWHDEFGSSNSDTTLTQIIQPLGANWVSLIVKCGADGTTVTCDLTKSTATDADLAHAVKTAHHLGLKVMLKPHLDRTDTSAGRDTINFGGDESRWQTWFTNYTTFITHYAALAQSLQIEYFVVGTELSGTVSRDADWRKVIAAVRQVYAGPLTYAGLNFRDETGVTWWDALDAIGIDAYYGLTLESDPGLTKLELGWTPYVTLLEGLASKWKKPIIFTEIGYLSVAGTNRSPSIWNIEGATDLQEQADCYRAIFEVFQGKSWWHGVFWWSYSIDPNQGGPADRTYSPHNKPAEQILRAYYGGVPQTPGVK
jgi:hypothetical protein